MTQQMEQSDSAGFTNPSEHTAPGKKPLKPRITDSKSKLTQIKKDVDKLIDSIVQNPSIFSRASRYWGNLPLWQKIVAGVVLVGLPLAVGILTNLFACFFISAFLLASYVGASVVLDDHHTHTKHSTSNIKSGVGSLAENLDLVTQILEDISLDLEEQVNIFTAENKRFGANIDNFSEQNSVLSQEISTLKETEKHLRITINELESTCNNATTSLTSQSQCLEETQAELRKIKLDYIQTEQTLRQKTAELDNLQRDFREKTEQYGAVVATLKVSLETISSVLLQDPKEQNEFAEKLKQFIDEKNANFAQILAITQNAARGINQVNEELQAAAVEQRQLLDESTRNFRQINALLAQGLYAQRENLEQEPTQYFSESACTH